MAFLNFATEPLSSEARFCTGCGTPRIASQAASLMLGALLLALLAATPALAARRCVTCPRDSHARILRSATERKAFERETGHPHSWPGHVIDHVVPLACGGADAPGNMQWQTRADAAAKDRWETSVLSLKFVYKIWRPRRGFGRQFWSR